MWLGDQIDCWLYPELKHFETEDARKQAVKDCLRQTNSGRGALVIWLCSGLTCAWTLLQVWLAPYLLTMGIPYGVGVGLACAVVVAIITFEIVFLLRDTQRRVRPRLREMLAGQTTPPCGNCGYDLDDNVSGMCPECGMKCTPSDAESMRQET